jgi:PAS domain S-box-containing protein
VTIRVLSVVNEHTVARSIQKILRNLGYEIVASVTSGEEAIVKAEELNPNIIITDIVLAGEIDGIETAKKIHQRASIPIIYLTSHIDESTLRKTRETDPYGYILKPVSEIELQTTIETALQRYSLERQLKKSEEWYRTIVENINDVIYILDTQGHITYISPVVERVSQYKTEEILGRNFVEFIHPDDLPELMESYNRTITGQLEPSEFRIFDKDGSVRYVRTSSHTIIEEGEVVGLTAVMTDITEHKLADVALQESEDRFRRLSDAAEEGIAIHDRGIIIEANEALARMFGYELHELIGINAEKLATPESWKTILKNISTMSEKPYEGIGVRKDGSTFYCQLVGKPYQYGGKTLRVARFTDITDRKLAEEALRESEKRYRQLVENANDIIYRTDDTGHITLVNPVALGILGYSEEEMMGKHYLDFIRPDYHRDAERFYGRQFVKAIQNTYYEFPAIKKDGNEIWLGQNVQLVKEEDRIVGFQAVSRDITHRKLAEIALQETEERYKALFERSFDAVFLHDFEGNFLDANTIALNMLGYTRDEIPTLSFSNLISDDQLTLAMDTLHEVLETGLQKTTNEYKLRRKEGGYVWVETRASLIYRKGKPYAIQGLARDITDRKLAEEQIKASLSEKEILLKEIHHRVKNNLQIIKSLLSLQSRKIQDEELLKLFNDSQNRIRAIALIHEKLYQSKDLSSIDFSEYIKTMVQELYSTYSENRVSITLNTELESILLNIQQAIPCGLILNELLTNAFKYAFPDGWGTQGQITISLLRDNNERIVLIVSDNGVGIPEDIDIEKVDSLGLQLVTLLARDQLDGEIKLERESGTRFTITLPFKGSK